MKTLSQQEIIDAACDLYGYGQEDFEGMSAKEIIKYLEDEGKYAYSDQYYPGAVLAEIREYCG